MGDRTSAMRNAVYLILFALFWGFAMFLADSIWGDDVAQWMAVAYVLINGFIIRFMLRKRRSC